MIEIEDQLSEMLSSRANDVAVEDRLDQITDGVHPMVDASRTAVGTTRRLVGVAAAAVVVLAGFGLVLSRQLSEPSDTIGAASPRDLVGDIYPILGSVGDLDATVYGTASLPIPEESPVAFVHLGRRDGELMTDVVSVSVSRHPDPILAGAAPGLAEPVDVNGREVTRYVRGGYEWYQWLVDGWTVAITDSVDVFELIEAVSVESTDADTVTAVRFSVLPLGLAVLDERYALEPDPLPGVSTDGGQTLSIDLYVNQGLGLPDLTEYRIVSIGGVEGLLGTTDDSIVLTWPVDDRYWAQLGTRGVTEKRALDMAADVRFVDRRTWESRYDTTLDDYSTPPTTLPPTTTAG